MKVGDRIMEMSGDYLTGKIQEIEIADGRPLFTVAFDNGTVRVLTMGTFEPFVENPNAVYVVMGDAWRPGEFDGMDSRLPSKHEFWPVAIFDTKPDALKYADEVNDDPSQVPNGIASARFTVMESKYYGTRVFKKDAGYDRFGVTHLDVTSGPDFTEEDIEAIRSAQDEFTRNADDD